MHSEEFMNCLWHITTVSKGVVTTLRLVDEILRRDSPNETTSLSLTESPSVNTYLTIVFCFFICSIVCLCIYFQNNPSTLSDSGKVVLESLKCAPNISVSMKNLEMGRVWQGVATCSPDTPANQNEISLVAYMQVILVAKVSKAILGIALNSIAPHFSYVCGVRESQDIASFKRSLKA